MSNILDFKNINLTSNYLTNVKDFIIKNCIDNTSQTDVCNIDSSISNLILFLEKERDSGKITTEIYNEIIYDLNKNRETINLMIIMGKNGIDINFTIADNIDNKLSISINLTSINFDYIPNLSFLNYPIIFAKFNNKIMRNIRKYGTLKYTEKMDNNISLIREWKQNVTYNTIQMVDKPKLYLDVDKNYNYIDIEKKYTKPKVVYGTRYINFLKENYCKFDKTDVKIYNSDILDIVELLNDNGKTCIMNLVNSKSPKHIFKGYDDQSSKICRRSDLYFNLKNVEEMGLYPLYEKMIYFDTIRVFRDSEKNGYRLLGYDKEPYEISVISLSSLNMKRKNKLTKIDKKIIKTKLRTFLNLAIEEGFNSVILELMGYQTMENIQYAIISIYSKIITKEYDGCFETIHITTLDEKQYIPLKKIFNN